MIARFAGSAGLTWGTACLHILEVLLVIAGVLTYSNKVWIAVAGATIYSVATVLLMLHKKSGAWLIITMPFVGGGAVVLGWALHFNIHPDLFNLMIFAVQLPGIVLAGQILGWWGTPGR